MDWCRKCKVCQYTKNKVGYNHSHKVVNHSHKVGYNHSHKVVNHSHKVVNHSHKVVNHSHKVGKPLTQGGKPLTQGGKPLTQGGKPLTQGGYNHSHKAGNPAVGVEWRWMPRHPTVTPNIMGLPYKDLMESFEPSVRIPGTKLVKDCGPVKAQSRIVGGEVATPHSLPWMVGLFIDDRYFCSGSIIDNEWVLTAGHCLHKAKRVEVVAGAQNIHQHEDSQISIVSTELYPHEHYNPVLLKNDVSLIHLPEPLTWSDAIAPVCLPSHSDPDLEPGVIVHPSGWGKSSDASYSISDELRVVAVPVISNDVCKEIYSVVTSATVCIDTSDGKGTCSGDSGGPMNYVKDGKTYNRAVVSFGPSTGCESGYPDGLTRVTHYLDWIETKTGIAIDN
ncbi:Serine proteases trypsin domain [Trinorchestia longiramus]|nr:Serine proteases trypsin domain [Trinorchestia longiramus]